MAFVLYFFGIEVPVSYLNKVISKTGKKNKKDVPECSLIRCHKRENYLSY